MTLVIILFNNNYKFSLSDLFTVGPIFYPWLWVRRYLIKHQAKIPYWPEDIQQQCQIEKDDPYDSTGKTRYLPPIKFTAVEYIVLALGFLTVLSIFGVFFAGVIYFGINVME